MAHQTYVKNVMTYQGSPLMTNTLKPGGALGSITPEISEILNRWQTIEKEIIHVNPNTN